MSFGGVSMPKRDMKPLGLDAYRASSVEQARPIPYLVGKKTVGLTFISDVFDVKTKSVGGGGKGQTRTGTNYYASFVGAACIGPVDALHAIYLNGDPVYTQNTDIVIKTLTNAGGTATVQTKNDHDLTTGDSVVIIGAEQLEYNGTHIITVTDDTHFTYPISSTPHSPATAPNNGQLYCRVLLPPIFRDDDNPDYVDVTIPDFGVMRLYWGTETQMPDSYWIGNSGIQQGANRGVCYAVFHQLFLGFNQTNVQNVELVLARYPKFDWLDAQNINDDTSLISFEVDILQHPRAGLRQPDSKLDIATLIATAGRLKDEELGFSPVVTREQEVRQLLVTANEYFDAYFSFTGDGKLGIKLIRPPTEELLKITDDDMLEKPSFDQQDWSAAFNETRVKFSNRLLDYKDDAVGRPDSGVLTITGEPKVQTLDREWVTDGGVATVLHDSAGRALALPAITGKLKLRIGLFDRLPPGAAFAINHSRRDTSNLIFRVETRTLNQPNKAEFEITFSADRSYVYE